MQTLGDSSKLPEPAASLSAAPETPPGGQHRSPISKARERLESGLFRWLNEQLYTSPSNTAVQLFSEHKDYFDVVREAARGPQSL
jgi:hypothetical protein